MLILSPLRDGHHQLKEEKQLGGGGRDEGEVEGFDFNGGNSVGAAGLDFPDFSGGMGNLLDSIDFDDLFIGIHDGDVLPDLEMDSEILDFSAHRDHGDEYYHNNAKTTLSKVEDQEEEEEEEEEGKDLDLVREAADSLTSATTTRNNQNYSSSSNTSTTTTSATQDQDRDGGHEEIGSKEDSNSNINNNISQIRASQHEQNQLLNQSSSPKESADQKLARKSSSTGQSKNSHGKRKVKVDWTPELHRRFVQAVEQLGVDKAVPSRILELMGIDCLTRHNIASHLQKYRSHRKHLLAREAEAASWTQRRQIYGAAAVSGGGGGGGGGGKSSRSDVMMMNSPNWLNAPTMGFPPIPSPTPPPTHHHHHHHHQMIRPLHVWGHPSMDQSMMHIWPKHLPHNFPSPIPPPPPPAHAWPPPPPLSDASYWHHPPPHHQRVPNALTPGTPCFPRQLATTTQQRFPSPPVPGIPPHAVYKVDPSIAVPSPQSGPHPLVDFHPSNESIDAAIGDVLSKPWLPLPLGLRPPATDSVMVELQRQGIPKIPPSCA